MDLNWILYGFPMQRTDLIYFWKEKIRNSITRWSELWSWQPRKEEVACPDESHLLLPPSSRQLPPPGCCHTGQFRLNTYTSLSPNILHHIRTNSAMGSWGQKRDWDHLEVINVHTCHLTVTLPGADSEKIHGAMAVWRQIHSSRAGPWIAH